MKTILAPVDFSPISDLVVEHAATLADALNGQIVLLHVLPPVPPAPNYIATPDDIEAMATTSRTTAVEQLTRLKDRLTAKAISVETVVLAGETGALIAAEAEKRQAAHIVMGSHGHTAFYELVAGTTTHGVVAQARCPVMIVPPHAGARRPRRATDENAGGESLAARSAGRAVTEMAKLPTFWLRAGTPGPQRLGA